jgi:hypothetical protein
MFRVIKSRRVRWVRYVVFTGDKNKNNRESEMKGPLRRLNGRLEGNIDRM